MFAVGCLFFIRRWTFDVRRSSFKTIFYEPSTVRYDQRTVILSEVDTTDHTFCLSLRIDVGSLVDSIHVLGLINPPILRRNNDRSYTILCGFRRVKACRLLKWPKIEARVVAANYSEAQLLELVIQDNTSHRSLNLIEQARGTQKLLSLRPTIDLGTLASLFGFPANKNIFQKIMALVELPEAVQEGLLDQKISFEAAVDLSGFSINDTMGLFDLLKGLKLSQNKQKEIITMAREIAIREDLQVLDVIQSPAVQTVLAGDELNRNEKATNIRNYLRKRRFPRLAKAEKSFFEDINQLKLNNYLHITPPANFEGRSYVLRMAFKDLKDLRKRRQELDALIQNPAMAKLLGERSELE